MDLFKQNLSKFDHMKFESVSNNSCVLNGTVCATHHATQDYLINLILGHTNGDQC